MSNKCVLFPEVACSSGQWNANEHDVLCPMSSDTENPGSKFHLELADDDKILTAGTQFWRRCVVDDEIIIIFSLSHLSTKPEA